MAHFHIPKPLHGWRAFAGEVGIIVLGVLIALGAEKLVATIHGREEMTQLRSALDEELADDRARWENLRAADACTLQRLNALNAWLARAPKGARVREAFLPLFWSMHLEAWDLAKASPVVQRIPLHERLTYASLYAGIAQWQNYLDEERDNSIAITSLFATADEPTNRAQISARIATARLLLVRQQRNYAFLFTRFNALGIRPDRTVQSVAFDPHALCAPLESNG